MKSHFPSQKMANPSSHFTASGPSLKSNAQRVHGKHIQVMEESLQSWYLKKGKVESILTPNILYDLTEL